jgi:betaine-aldehyde dehydrogenase
VQYRFKTAFNFVDGAFVDNGSAERMPAIDPATGEIIGDYAPGSAALVERAVDVARLTFFQSTWAKNARQRAAVLYEYADKLEAAREQFIELLILEAGKLRSEADGEVEASISEARFYAGLARLPHGRSSEIVPDSLSVLSREAAGVVAVIVPWNAPLTLLVRSLAPSLAAGCTNIVKPAPQTTLVNDLAMRLLLEISSLPDGVVQVVNENGIEVGQALASSPGIDVITFTGSSRTGKHIMAAAAPTLKRLSLELGGKAPALIFPDADLDNTVKELRFGSLRLAGQFCMCATRYLIHDAVYDEVVSRFKASFSNVAMGPGTNLASQMGPLIDKANQKRVLDLIERASDEADVVLRGKAGEADLSKGAFVSPTLVAVDDTASHLVQDEHFAPLVVLERFGSDEEALTKAHATRYGLAASVHTKDLKKAHQMARNLRFGTVWVNCHRRNFAEAEVGGFGESGIGRLHGVEGLSDFLETKHIHLNLA